MQEYRKCVQLWKNWSEQAPDEIREKLPAFEEASSYHSVKTDYPELPYTTAAKLWCTSTICGYTGNIYALIALNNHKVALSLCNDCLEGGVELSVDLLCGIQHALSCGLYTPEDYVVREERPGEFRQGAGTSSIAVDGAELEDTEQAVASLLNEMCEVEKANEIIVAAAYLHARLMFIEPFTVCNASLCRMVTNYWLMQKGHPPLFIPSTEHDRYKLCLEQFDFHEDIEPLVKLFIEQVTTYWGPHLLNATPRDGSPAKSVFTFKLK